MDLKPHAPGDYSISVVQANSSLEDQDQVFISPSATYVVVYDGDGGPEASRFITNHLFSYLRKFTTEQGGLSAEVIRKAFGAIEEEFLHLVKQAITASSASNCFCWFLLGQFRQTNCTWRILVTRGPYSVEEYRMANEYCNCGGRTLIQRS